MDVQAWVFPTLAAIHNSIFERDPIEIANMLPPSDDGIDFEDPGQLATEYPGQAEKTEMWWDHREYVEWLSDSAPRAKFVGLYFVTQ